MNDTENEIIEIDDGPHIVKHKPKKEYKSKTVNKKTKEIASVSEVADIPEYNVDMQEEYQQLRRHRVEEEMEGDLGSQPVAEDPQTGKVFPVVGGSPDAGD